MGGALFLALRTHLGIGPMGSLVSWSDILVADGGLLGGCG